MELDDQPRHAVAASATLRDEPNGRFSRLRRAFGLDGDDPYAPSMWARRDSGAVTGVLTITRNGTVLPARIKNGAHRYDEMLEVDAPVLLTYVPRLAQWAEQGPVELDVADVRLEDRASDDPHQARALP